ncbi:MAG: divalent-cation tolerance protein CutA [Xanthomonadales bacterium]|nr:divalent-cation tolerance protein CutA [Xanthomonadales bacterium]
MHPMFVVFCTCPNDQTAGDLAAALVERRLAACVNVLPGVRSIYRWQGQVHDDSETLLIVKTGRAAYPALQSWLANAHPYDVPEIIALPVGEGLPAYIDWVVQKTADRNENSSEKKT